MRIQFGPVEASAAWVGDEAKGEAPVIDGMRVRVLAAGSNWTPPPATAGSPDTQTSYAFILGDQRVSLATEGAPAFDGWKVASIKRYAHATVAGDGLIEDPAQKGNAAVEVVISDGKGSSEKHTAFEGFPDMVLAKSVEGTSRSGARLVPPAKNEAPKDAETLVIFGNPPAMKLGYIARDGSSKVLEHDGAFPWGVDLGQRKLTILQQFTKAREESRFTQAPPAKDHRPALVFKAAQGQSQVIAWKGTAPFNLPGRVGMLRFTPRMVTLPFSLRLDEFRKSDYPGTEMAMAYESDVTVTAADASERKATISMNNPLVESGWKVYQSGFMGTTTSIFSVMRDPGLILTYISSVGLCVGILITFYGRGLSWGHPGIPIPFSGKEQSHAPVSVCSDSVVVPSDTRPGIGSAALDTAIGFAADPGRRPSHATGHIRA